MPSQTIEYHDGDTPLRGVLVSNDAGHGKRPGVLIMPEAWGVTEHERGIAERLADKGYVALAGDFYGNGANPPTIQEAMALAAPLREDPPRLRRRVRANLEALASRPDVDPNRLAAIGYCMGGMCVLELARAGAPIQGVVSFHGRLETKQPAEPGHMHAKVLVCTGAADTHIPPAHVTAFQEEMQRAGVDWEINVYGGAKHGFTNPAADKRGLPGVGYNAAADRRSWAAMETLFGEIF
jgi:dienelactone hydrolase